MTQTSRKILVELGYSRVDCGAGTLEKKTVATEIPVPKDLYDRLLEYLSKYDNDGWGDPEYVNIQITKDQE